MFFLDSLRRWWINRHRNIFRYWDGSRNRYADPVVIGTKLEEFDPDYQDKLNLIAESPSKIPPGNIRDEMVKKQKEAMQHLAKMSRSVFGVPPMDDKTGIGATDGECIRIIAGYFLFMEGLARSAKLFPDSQRSVSDSPADSLIPSSAESGTAASTSA